MLIVVLFIVVLSIIFVRRSLISVYERRERRGDEGEDADHRALLQALPDIVESYIGAVFVDSEYEYGEVERFFERHVKPFFENMSIYDTYANNHPTVHTLFSFSFHSIFPLIEPKTPPAKRISCPDISTNKLPTNHQLTSPPREQTFLTNLLTLSFHCTNFRILSQEIPALNPSSISSSSSSVLAAVMIHNDFVAEGRAASGKSAKVKASSNALNKLQDLSEAEFRKTYRCDCTGEGVAAGGGGGGGGGEVVGSGAAGAATATAATATAPAGVGRAAIRD